ncbi:MAG: cytochrome c oxidase subunit II [Thermoleophilaceae bacterium]
MRSRAGRRPMLTAVVLSIVATAVGIFLALQIDWFPTQATTKAHEIDTLYDVLLIVSVPIFVLVMAVVIFSVTQFKAKPGDLGDGAPIHGNTKLEIIWVTIPFLIVSALSIYGWVVLNSIEAKAGNTMVVNVKGQQFAWSFSYPSEGKVKSNTLMLPKDRPIEFRINTDDVLHDFWVPAFRVKSDAVPGLTTKIRATPNKLGTYAVVCAELCGLGHSTMRSRVQVMPAEKFNAWIASKQKGAAK